VALAAIQGLNALVKEKDARIDALTTHVDTLARELAAIKKKLGLD
jgi:uncharacterized coiled-coil protein SlyX